jgi:hypothetical protein
MAEVRISKTRNGVYVYFPADYIRRVYNDAIPEFITLLCDGREIRARFSMMTNSAVRYRVYDRFVPALMESDNCYLVVEQKV